MDVVWNTNSSSIIKCLKKHFTCHGIPETLRMGNGSNLVNHEMQELLDGLGIKHKCTIPLWPKANGKVERQNKSLLKAMCTRGPRWRETMATRIAEILLAYRSTLHTKGALKSCCMEGESEPNCKSLKALRRKERDLVLQTTRHKTRMLNENKEVLMVQTKDLWSLMCQKETRCYWWGRKRTSCLQRIIQGHTV